MTNLEARPAARVDMGRRADGERFTLPTPGNGLIHTLVSGKTGSGKSSTVAKLVGDLAPNPDIAFCGIDFKAGLELLPWAPRFTSIATTRDDCDHLLNQILDEITRRAATIIAAATERGRTIRAWEPDMGPRIVIVIDEARELAYNKTSIERLDSIAARSRALGIHIVAATQYALAKDFPSTLLANLDHRICHRLGTLTQYAVALAVDQAELKDAGVVAIPTGQPGVCYVTGIPGTPDFMRCRSDWVPDDAIDRRAADTAHLRWDPEDLYTQ